MAAHPGKIRSKTTAPAQAAAAATAGTASGTDSSLPDPTREAKIGLATLSAGAFLLAVGMNAAHVVHAPFVPAAGGTSNFSLFAGFYVAAQAIERLLELISPLLPWWAPPSDGTTAADKVAHAKADRAALSMGLATVAGVAASAGFGLFFLRAVGITTPQTIDCFLTGVIIAAGTKPLHDFISYVQNQSSPPTGSATG